MATVLSKLFMRTISQSSNDNQTGISLWTIDDVKAAQEKQRLLLQAQHQTPGQDVDMDMDNEPGDSDDYGDGGIPDEILHAMEVEA
jgi:DNA excision repair protein ERCC-2